jgi:TonB family protein
MPTSITFDTDVIRGPAWWDSEVNLRLHDTTLDKALAVFEKAGVKVEYLGSAPAVHASYEKERVQEVLDDLARKYALEMDLVAPTRLRVKALPGPGTAGIEPPVLETRSDPRRPDLHGTVDMNLVVGADGTVQTATVVRPSGKADFDADALESVRSWRYRPATQQGKPVPVYVPIRIER